jgi:predicted O-linked N-acetylglucosamine transferase (SPINDLY family)
LLICAQSSFKWNSAFVDTVATILLKHANAKLVYFRNRDVLAALAFEQFLEQRLIARGLSPRERVIAMSETSRERFLAILAACDLALDTFGFSGGNTTLDSLSVGLPVVTLPGDFMRGRQSMAMLEMLDVSALVAKDSDDYVRIVLDLLSRANMRVGLRARLLASAPSLFDDYTPIDALRNWLLTYAREHKFDQSTSHPSLPNDASGNRSTKLYRSGQTVDRC